MSRTLIVLALVLLISLAGCGKSKKGVMLMDGPSYLQLRGVCEDVSLQVDDNARVELADKCEEAQYQVEPGLHTLRFYRDGSLILERKVSLGAGEIYEVRLP